MKLFDRWSIAILVIVAAWMVWAAGYYTVFDDEAFSCQRYVLPMGEMVRALWDGVEPDPPLYYVLQNLSVRVVGVGPLGLRALSIVMFLGGLLAMQTAGRAWFGERVGNVTILLCAVHPAHLFFGFAARWYSTMFLMVGLLLWVTAKLARFEMPRAGGDFSHSGPHPDPPLLKGRELSAGHDEGESGGGHGGRETEVLHGACPIRAARQERWLILGWGVVAAGVCYTNYFGPVVVGLVWLVSILRHSCRMRWIGAGVIAAALFAPWWPPFWRQVAAFPQFDGGAMSMAATAGRTMMALCVGNLASPRAWWVWGPMAVFGVLVVVRVWSERRRVWPIAIIVVGCFVAGAVSRTMIDKYVMTFSGVACLLVAAVLCWEKASHRLETCVTQHRLKTGATGTVRLAACTTLALAWLGCGVNLVMGRNWSSLRWLDPIEEVCRHSIALWEVPNQWIATHPSVSYYRACLYGHGWVTLDEKSDARLSEDRRWVSEISLRYAWPDEWRRVLSHEYSSATGIVTLTPLEGLGRISSNLLPAVLTIETSEFSNLPDWIALREELSERYRMKWEETYLQDEDAAWKDRVDPKFKHPRWRITVRVWERAKPG